MIAGVIIASRPQGYVVYPLRPPVFGRVTGHLSRSTTARPRRRLYGAN